MEKKQWCANKYWLNYVYVRYSNTETAKHTEDNTTALCWSYNKTHNIESSSSLAKIKDFVDQDSRKLYYISHIQTLLN